MISSEQLISDRLDPSRRQRQHAAVTRPIKILHVHGRMGRGGAEMRTLEILRHIDRRRYRFHFCAVSGRPGDLDEEIRNLGGEVHLVGRTQAGFPRRFRELLRHHQFDVVHSHLHYISGLLLRLAAQCGVAVRVAHFRSSQVDRVSGLGRKTYRLARRLWIDRGVPQFVMRRWIDRYATDVLGVSRWALARAWNPHWESDPRCRVVYDGLEPSSFDGTSDGEEVRREFDLPRDAPLFIHVGRMNEAKNHVRLISIFADLLRRRPAARLLLVGRSEKTIERGIRSRVEALGIPDRVVLAGERADVPRLLKAADLLIFPSRWEGLGDVVLEACAAGTPTLASDLPSIREIAAQLPGVRLLSLQQPDSQWAHLAAEMLDKPISDQDRRLALENFAHSVFTVEKCTQTLCRIWQGNAARCEMGEDIDG